MSHQASTQTIPARTSQWMRGYGLLLVLIPVGCRPVVSPSHQSSFLRPLASFPREDDSRGLAVRFTHRLLSLLELVVSNHKIWSGAIASASSTGILQADVSIERQFSRIFPAHPRSLARCLSRARRRGTALLFRLSENLFAKSPHRTRTKRLPEPSENAPFGLGNGAHSRRFAQECPEGNPGKYTKEK